MPRTGTILIVLIVLGLAIAAAYGGGLLKINPEPECGFAADVQGLSVRFTVIEGTGRYGNACPTYGAARYGWNFGDGRMESSSSSSIYHTYAASGRYTVSVTGYDASNTVLGKYTEPVNVGTAPLTVDWEYSIDRQTVTFTGHAGGGIPPYVFQWTFGDGTPVVTDTPPGQLDTVTHAYGVGTWTASLMVFDHTGASLSPAGQTIVISPPPLVVGIEITEINKLAVSLNAVADGGVFPYSYSWDFGDSSMKVTSSPVTFHTYSINGTYHIILNVIDGRETSVSASKDVTVRTAPLPPTSPSLTVSFSVEVTKGLASFTPTVSGGTEPYTYSWDFGDGTEVSNAEGPAHIFKESGTYVVTLIVDDSTNLTKTVTKSVEIVTPGEFVFNTTMLILLLIGLVLLISGIVLLARGHPVGGWISVVLFVVIVLVVLAIGFGVLAFSVVG